MRSDDDKLNQQARLVNRLSIDRDGLDVELIEQPHLFHTTAHAKATAISRRDAAKDELKRAEAQASLRIRRTYERSGAKTTESAIASEVILDPAVGKAQAALRAANAEVAEWEALTEAWQQRSYALKDLVVLHVNAYSMGNTSTAGGPAARRATEDANNRQIKAEKYKPYKKPKRETLDG